MKCIYFMNPVNVPSSGENIPPIVPGLTVSVLTTISVVWSITEGSGKAPTNPQLGSGSEGLGHLTT